MVSIKDVARHANVSISTVSNVINNKCNVRADVYTRVMAAINELNYNPNMLARNLRKNKTNIIGVVLPNLHGYYNQILQGIIHTLGNNAHVILKTTGNDKGEEKVILDELVNMGIKGILIVSCNESNTDFFDSILTKKIPIVFMERCISGKDYCSVQFDNATIIHEAVCSLLHNAQDNHNIILIAGPEDFSSERDCERGFISACTENNIDLENKVLHLNISQEYSFRKLLAYVQQLKKIPDYFITTNDILAECLSEILSMLNSKSNIYTMSGDNWHEFNSNEKSFSSIKRNAIELGIESTKLLLEYIDSPVIFENRQIYVSNTNIDNTEIIYKKRESNTSICKKLNLLMLEGPTLNSLIQLIPNFENYFNISIDYEKLSYTDLYQRITEEHKGQREHFDIYMFDLPWIKSFIENKYLFKLDEFINESNDHFISNYISSISNAFFKHTSHVYALPLMVGVQMLFYREDLFKDQDTRRLFYKEYGIELHTPRTWTEFNLIAKFFTRKYNYNSPVEFGTCLSGLNPTGIVEEILPRLWSYNGRIFSVKDGFTINKIESLKAIHNLCESYLYSPPESINYWWDDQVNKFAEGNIAMINTFNSHIGKIYDQQFSNMRNNINFNIIPGNAPMLGGWALGINKYSNNPIESFKFIKWACSNKLSIHNTLLGGMVPKINVSTSKQLHIAYPWLQNISRYFEAGRQREIIRNKKGEILDMNQFEKVLADGIIDTILGNIKPQEMLNQLKLKFESIADCN